MVAAHMQPHQRVSPGYTEFLPKKRQFNYWQQSGELTVVTQDLTTVTGRGFSRIFPLAREEPSAHNLWYKLVVLFLCVNRDLTLTCQFLAVFCYPWKLSNVCDTFPGCFPLSVQANNFFQCSSKLATGVVSFHSPLVLGVFLLLPGCCTFLCTTAKSLM